MDEAAAPVLLPSCPFIRAFFIPLLAQSGDDGTSRSIAKAEDLLRVEIDPPALVTAQL